MPVRIKAKYHDLFVSLVSGASLITMASAQTCDSLLGGANCGANIPRPGAASRPADPQSPKLGSDWSFGGRSSGQGLGVDLSSTASNDTGFFGAITFSGGGTTCSGPLRSRRC
jgi:hypothetical protein